MIRITIDDEQKKKLLDAEGIVELCDTSGKLLGYFLSLSQERNFWKVLLPELSEEEIQRRVDTGEPGFTSEQVKEYLRMRA